MQTTIRTIIKNILAFTGVFVLVIFVIYDNEKANILLKLLLIISPLYFSSLVLHKRKYEEKMRSTIRSKGLKRFMTYEMFENISILFLLFLNVSMLTGIAYKYFGFGNIISIYILFLYLILTPLIAEVIKRLFFKTNSVK